MKKFEKMALNNIKLEVGGLNSLHGYDNKARTIH